MERRPQVRHGRASRIDCEQVKRLLNAQPDLTLHALRDALAALGTTVSPSHLWWLLRGLGYWLKKSIHAAERDTEANRRTRKEFVTRLRTILPERLIFLDETGATTHHDEALRTLPRRHRRGHPGRALEDGHADWRDRWADIGRRITSSQDYQVDHNPQSN